MAFGADDGGQGARSIILVDFMADPPDEPSLTRRRARSLPCVPLLLADDAAEVPHIWRRLGEFLLRPRQEETAAALATGCHALARPPTGTGKTMVPMLKAAADCAAGLQR